MPTKRKPAKDARDGARTLRDGIPGSAALDEAELEMAHYFDRYTYLWYNLGQLVQAQRTARIPKYTPSIPLVNAEGILDMVEHLVNNATNDRLCFDNFKNLYFCTRKKGHRGQHQDDFGFVWDMVK